MHVRREKSLFAKSDRISTTQFSLLLSRLLSRVLFQMDKKVTLFLLFCATCAQSVLSCSTFSSSFLYFPYLRQISDVGVGPLVKKKKG